VLLLRGKIGVCALQAKDAPKTKIARPDVLILFAICDEVL
jgi:hypothetical protein